LTGLACIDIEHPLLLSWISNNILMRELFPHSNKKASPFENSAEMLRKRDFRGMEPETPYTAMSTVDPFLQRRT
jgi:hypothetical protein